MGFTRRGGQQNGRRLSSLDETMSNCKKACGSVLRRRVKLLM